MERAAAAFLECVTKRGLLCNGLRLCVDQPESDLDILRPIRHDTPAQHIEPATVASGIGVRPRRGEPTSGV